MTKKELEKENKRLQQELDTLKIQIDSTCEFAEIRIGQLEEKKKAGIRSKFIKEAIQEKLSRVESGTLDDWSSKLMLMCVRDRLHKGIGYGISKMESEIYQKMLQILIDYYLELDS